MGKKQMDTTNEKHEHGHGHGCCGHGGYRSHWFVRLVIVVVGLLLAFKLGLALGKIHGGFWDDDKFGYGMMVNGPGGYGGMMGNLMWGGRTENFAGSAMAGIVTKVEGNKITLTDNGGKTQIITTSSNSIIVVDGQEAGLNSLKAGQYLRATGTRGKDSSFTAKMIQASTP